MEKVLKELWTLYIYIYNSLQYVDIILSIYVYLHTCPQLCGAVVSRGFSVAVVKVCCGSNQAVSVAVVKV